LDDQGTPFFPTRSGISLVKSDVLIGLGLFTWLAFWGFFSSVLGIKPGISHVLLGSTPAPYLL
jgi:hypothetical protein